MTKSNEHVYSMNPVQPLYSDIDLMELTDELCLQLRVYSHDQEPSQLYRSFAKHLKRFIRENKLDTCKRYQASMPLEGEEDADVTCITCQKVLR